MSTTKRLVEMILRGHPDKFKSILQEELRYRAAGLMEKIYKEESKKILEILEETVAVPKKTRSSTDTGKRYFRTRKRV